jgi:hypothetical protein
MSKKSNNWQAEIDEDFDSEEIFGYWDEVPEASLTVKPDRATLRQERHQARLRKQAKEEMQ